MCYCFRYNYVRNGQPVNNLLQFATLSSPAQRSDTMKSRFNSLDDENVDDNEEEGEDDDDVTLTSSIPHPRIEMLKSTNIQVKLFWIYGEWSRNLSTIILYFKIFEG